jgi:hypothetical protein
MPVKFDWIEITRWETSDWTCSALGGWAVG